MPVPDMSKTLSGHPEGGPDPEGEVGKRDMALIGPSFTSFDLPFGTVYSTNLTSHETGIGSWTEAEFVASMRTGKHKGTGRAVLPPMPWLDIGHSTDEDLRAIFAYLKSVPPIDNKVPDPKVPPPVLEGMAAGADGLVAMMAKMPPSKLEGVAERGEYLATLGGCNHCHTPWAMNEKMKMPMPDMSKMMTGHPADGPAPMGKVGKHDMALIGPSFTSFDLPFGRVYSPNLTKSAAGTETWNEQMFIDSMRKGKHLGGDDRSILPPMPWMEIRALNDDDLKALFAYMHAAPPSDNAVPAHTVPGPAVAGISAGFDALMEKMKGGGNKAKAEAATPGKAAKGEKAGKAGH